jgi:hypothetical protein
MPTRPHLPTIEFRTILIALCTCAALVLIVAYIAFQARFLIAGPQIDLTSELTIHHNNRTVELQGSTHNITHLWLNDRQIYTDKDGNFKEALVLENGYTIATLRAKDRFGRETRIERPFVYTPASFSKQ